MGWLLSPAGVSILDHKPASGPVRVLAQSVAALALSFLGFWIAYLSTGPSCLDSVFNALLVGGPLGAFAGALGVELVFMLRSKVRSGQYGYLIQRIDVGTIVLGVAFSFLGAILSAAVLLISAQLPSSKITMYLIPVVATAATVLGFNLKTILSTATTSRT